MKDLRKKRKTIIIFLTIAFIWIAVGTIWNCFVRGLDASYSSASSKADSFVQAYYYISSQMENANGGFDNDITGRANLIETARQADPDNFKPATYGTGYIVKLEDGNLEAPDGFPSDAVAIVSDLQGVKGQLVSDTRLIRYTAINGPYYYVEIDYDDEKDAVTTDELGMSSGLSSLANVSGCEFLFISESDTITDENYVFTATNEFSDCTFMSDAGFSARALKELSSGDDASVMAKVRGNVYWIRSKRFPAAEKLGGIVITLVPVQSILLRSLQQSAMPLFIAMIICIALSVWIMSIYRTVRNNVLTEERRRMYAPAAVKRKMIAAVVSCTLIVLVSSLFMFSLDSLFVTSFNQETTLSEYFNQVDEDIKRADIIWKASQERYTGNARLIAGLLDDHRELQTTAWLRAAARTLGADYITIYDTNGDEVVSGSRYRGLWLGKDNKSATYDFRRLLRGVHSISHAGVTDEVTGLTRDMYGISLRYLGNETSYGALIMAVDSSDQPYTIITDIDETASTMAPEGGFIIGVDPESDIIKYSSESSFKGAHLKDICTNLKTYEGGFMGFADINGADYYMSSAKHDGLIYYCAEPESSMFGNVVSNSMDSVFRFAALAIILALMLLSGYDQKTFDEYAAKDVPREVPGTRLDKLRSTVAAASESGLSRKQSAFLERRYSSFLNHDLTPGERVIKVIQILILIFSALGSFFVFLDKLDARGAAGSNVVEYIIHGNWERGFNLFSVTAILFLICIVVVWLYALRAAESLVYGFVRSKGRSTFMLVSNLLFYSVVIVCIFMALGYLGVNARALVASAGIAGLAISLGARDLIADIISGVMILVDNTYNVGDIVQIGDFRGEVAEIGIRSTRIIGRGDNIKTIRNSTVGDVINYSRLNSWYPLLLIIDSTQSLGQVEDMLKEELPKIAAKHPEIVSGPDYRGIDSINGEKITILILTECHERDYDRVQLIVNREVRSVFKRNRITLY